MVVSGGLAGAQWRWRASGVAIRIGGSIDVEEVERLAGDGEADLAVLVVEVRLADRSEGAGLEDRSVLGEEGAERQGGCGDGLDVPLDELPGYAGGVSPSDDGVGVGAVDGPAVLHRLAAHGRRQLGGVVEGEREDVGAEGGAGLFGVAVCGSGRAVR